MRCFRRAASVSDLLKSEIERLEPTYSVFTAGLSIKFSYVVGIVAEQREILVTRT